MNPSGLKTKIKWLHIEKLRIRMSIMSYSGGFPLKFRFCYVPKMIARFHEPLVLELWNLVTWERKACVFQISKSICCQSNPWLWAYFVQNPKFLTENWHGSLKNRLLICKINTPLQSIQIKHTLYPKTAIYIERKPQFLCTTDTLPGLYILAIYPTLRNNYKNVFGAFSHAAYNGYTIL